MIRFQCPSCRAAMSAPDHFAGRASKCRGCHAPLTVPAEADITDQIPPAPPAAPAGPSSTARTVWILACVAVLGLLFGGLASAAGQSDPAGVVGQCRNLIALCLIMLGVYILARAIDRLTS